MFNPIFIACVNSSVDGEKNWINVKDYTLCFLVTMETRLCTDDCRTKILEICQNNNRTSTGLGGARAQSLT